MRTVTVQAFVPAGFADSGWDTVTVDLDPNLSKSTLLYQVDRYMVSCNEVTKWRHGGCEYRTDSIPTPQCVRATWPSVWVLDNRPRILTAATDQDRAWGMTIKAAFVADRIAAALGESK